MSMTVSSPRHRQLAEAGYRPITLNSYLEMMGGVRYISAEKNSYLEKDEKIDTITYRQFLPEGDATWCIWTLDGSYCCNKFSASRSSIHTAGFPDPKKLEWYAKVAGKIYASIYDMNTSPKKGYSTHLSFNMFITGEVGGYDPPMDMQWAFNKQHPLGETARKEADLNRQRLELAAREDEAKQTVAFAEVRELMAVATRFQEAGDSRTARAYREAAEGLRGRVQAALDAKKPVVRENVVVDIAPMPLTPPPIELSATLTSGSKKQPRKPKLEIVEVCKRVIVLDD